MIKIKSAGQALKLGHMKNYFAAAWIANLGVVPLFLLAAFLFAPAFFFFLNLLLFVTHVLETIGPLLYNRNFRRRIKSIVIYFKNSNLKPSFLPIFYRGVKGIFLLLYLNPLFSPAVKAEDFILGRGQSLTIAMPEMAKFNINNKEVLNYRFDEKNKNMIVRGAMVGVAQILYWDKLNKEPKEHQVFVISKVQEAKFLHLAQILRNIGLSTKIGLPHLEVKGQIAELSTYLKFKKIQKLNAEVILDEVQLTNELKKDILADILKLLYEDFRENFKCEIQNTDISCIVPQNDAPSESLKKHLGSKYQVNFIEVNNQKLIKNYTFKLKLIQLEQTDGEEIRLGLEELNASIADLIHNPLIRILEKNAILLAQKNIKINTLAEPSGVIRALSPAEFQIGADVPYSQMNKEGAFTNTQWQFAGLKVRLLLENIGQKIKISYETELTKPSSENNGAISGNKEKSTVILTPLTPIKLFEITLKTEAHGIDQMPFLNRIPLLGELFKSKSNQNNYKTITGILEISENE